MTHNNMYDIIVAHNYMKLNNGSNETAFEIILCIGYKHALRRSIIYE